MYVKKLDANDELLLKQRRNKIREFQNKGICFSCENFVTGDVFPDDGLIIYEDYKVRCMFERFPRVLGQTIIVSKDHYEDISEMPIEIGIHILKIQNEIIKLHKEILKAEKVYMCTICDGKRNHLHFQLFPRFKGDPIGYQNFVHEEGIIMDYHETAEIYRNALQNIEI